MKRLLSFTLLFCFGFFSMHAVQQKEDTTVIKVESSVKTKAIEETVADKSCSFKNKVIVIRKQHAKSARQIQGVLGHAIKRVSHRALIDKRKRIAGNY